MGHASFTLIACTALAGCVLGNRSDLSRAVGKPEAELFAEAGTPARQFTARSGAKVYVYDQPSLNGQNVLCSLSFFVRNGVVVGVSEGGATMNCGGSAGKID